MCWSASASLVFGVTGLATAAVTSSRGTSHNLAIPLAYFSLMEFLQFFSYWYIGECSFAQNNILTFLSYVHISFQPLFINMCLLYSVPYKVSPRVKKIVYSVSLLTTSIMLLKLIPFVKESLCTIGQTMCGPLLCTVPGVWHLAWSVPQYLFPIPGDTMAFYALGAFVPAFFYGAWRGSLIMILTGPVLAYFLTNGNPLEWPAVWCLYSVSLIFLVMFGRAYKEKRGMRSYLELFK